MESFFSVGIETDMYMLMNMGINCIFWTNSVYLELEGE